MAKFDFIAPTDKPAHERQRYLAMVHLADAMVGNVTAALMRQGMWDNLLLVFSTDNGAPTPRMHPPTCACMQHVPPTYAATRPLAPSQASCWPPARPPAGPQGPLCAAPWELCPPSLPRMRHVLTLHQAGPSTVTVPRGQTTTR